MCCILRRVVQWPALPSPAARRQGFAIVLRPIAAASAVYRLRRDPVIGCREQGGLGREESGMSPRRLTLNCTLALAGLLAIAGSSVALAQFLPNPGQSAGFPPGSNPFPPPPGSGQQQPQSGAFPPPGNQQVCATFPAIRDDAEKGAMAIKAASDRKATREEVCPLFKNFAAKESRLVQFLVKHQSTCGVPPDAVKQARANHARTIQIRNQVCAAGPSAPAGPSLSDALGGPIIADDTSIKPGRGTFDTLTGNPLSR
jgi:hypothetical protein